MHDKDKKLELLRGLEKLKGSKVKSDDYTSDLDKDVIRVKGKPAQPEAVTRIKNATDRIDTNQIVKLKDATDHIDTRQSQKLVSGTDFQSKIQALLKNSAAKKALGILPMAGTVAGLMAGDPAMAAEEAAGDIPVLGQAYEAIKPTESGNPEEERLMLAEDQARKNYAKSPARFNRLNNMIKK